MLVFLSVGRLNLLVATVAGLTGTWWGFATAMVVLTVLAVRSRSRGRSAARAGVLAPPEHADPLDATRRPGEVAAHP